MAIKKLRKHRLNADGEYDVLHYETEADLVLMEDGSTVAESFDNKLDVDNPVATGSFSLGRKSGSTVGKYSFAFGYDVEASGYASHAEGGASVASNYGAHSEGWNSCASGEYTHAEGDRTIASGYASHAEGCSSSADGSRSHAEGTYTTASGNDQHVQGKHNISDTTSAHIVGNGSSLTPSNAHTLDWDGNAWFAGDVYVGSTSGTNKDEGSVKLATEAYVDAAIAAAITEAFANIATVEGGSF